MPRPSRAPRPAAARPGVPFDTAAEAWFWCVQCLLARADGARITAGLGLVARPCDPEDVLMAAERLLRRGRLRRGHLRVLGEAGRAGLPPDPRVRASETPARLWAEAIDRLATALMARGIVQVPDPEEARPDGGRTGRAAAGGRAAP